MAYVLPNGTIQIGTINGLDNRYMHTIYFANESAQNTFMSGKLTKTFNKTSYLRMGAGAIKINGSPIEEVSTPINVYIVIIY